MKEFLFWMALIAPCLIVWLTLCSLQCHKIPFSKANIILSVVPILNVAVFVYLIFPFISSNSRRKTTYRRELAAIEKSFNFFEKHFLLAPSRFKGNESDEGNFISFEINDGSLLSYHTHSLLFKTWKFVSRSETVFGNAERWKISKTEYEDFFLKEEARDFINLFSEEKKDLLLFLEERHNESDVRQLIIHHSDIFSNLLAIFKQSFQEGNEMSSTNWEQFHEVFFNFSEAAKKFKSQLIDKEKAVKQQNSRVLEKKTFQELEVQKKLLGTTLKN